MELRLAPVGGVDATAKTTPRGLTPTAQTQYYHKLSQYYVALAVQIYRYHLDAVEVVIGTEEKLLLGRSASGE